MPQRECDKCGHPIEEFQKDERVQPYAVQAYAHKNIWDCKPTVNPMVKAGVENEPGEFYGIDPMPESDVEPRPHGYDETGMEPEPVVAEAEPEPETVPAEKPRQPDSVWGRIMDGRWPRL